MYYPFYEDDYTPVAFFKDVLEHHQKHSALAKRFWDDLDKVQEAYTLLQNEISRRVFISSLFSLLFRALSAKSLSDMFAFYQQSLNGKKIIDAGELFYKYFTPECRDKKQFGWSIAECFVIEQYRYNENDICITVNEDDICLDVGAYIGDSSLWMALQGKAKRVYAFEFSDAAYRLLQKNSVYTIECQNAIIPVKMAVSDKDGLVPIQISKRDLLSVGNDVIVNEEQYFSKYSQDSVCYVDGITIDTFCAERNEVPSYIKADVEGAESRLIAGAKSMLEQYQPKLAISAYHFPWDMYELLLQIHKINRNYQFYMQKKGHDIVLFAR